MKPRIRDAGAASLLAIGALGSAALAFSVQACLARSLSGVEYGHMAAALAVLTIIAPAFGFGVPAFWLKAYGAEGWAARRWMSVSMHFMVRSGLLCLVAALAWSWIGAIDRTASQLLLAMLPVVLTQGAIEMASTKLQLEERFGRVALWQALQHAARLVLVLICWKLGAHSFTIALGFGCIGALIALGAWRAVSMLRRGAVKLVGHGSEPAALGADRNLPIPSAAELWRNTMPFGVASLLFYAYSQSGLLIVSHVGAAQDVGAYSVAVTVLSALYLLPTVLFQKLLMPRFHRWAASGDDRLEHAYRRSNKWMFTLGLAAACSAAFLAPIAIPLLFGKQYAQSVTVIMIMTASAPFRFLTISASSVMTTRDLIRVRNWCAAAALLFSVVTGVIGVMLAGTTGMAIASVTGEIVWALLSVLCTHHFLSHARRTGEQADWSASRNYMWSSAREARVPVSVIIPCFNCIHTIERAVHSVFQQTCRPQELILVDDCSTDGTREFLDELAQTYPAGWIRVLSQSRNAGPGAARNAAWAVATQPYIAFLDSDDSWNPAKLAVQYGWMRARPEVTITGHPVVQIEAGESVTSLPSSSIEEPRRVSRYRILFSNRFTPSSILVRANVGARFDESKRYAEDYFMLLEVALVEGGSAYLFSFPLSYVYKPQFGARTGLSGQLWKIQVGEQNNYLRFRKRGLISNVEWAIFSSMSMIKYLRRCVLSRRLA